MIPRPRLLPPTITFIPLWYLTLSSYISVELSMRIFTASFSKTSVISAIAKKYAAKRIETDGASDAWWPQLHSFAIGLKGAPDLIKAREVAEYIGTVHHEINYTLQEGLDVLPSRAQVEVQSHGTEPQL